MAVFRNGSNGVEVTRIQQRLAELGLLSASPDGVYGAQTEAAVRRFQQSQGLAVDGAVGPQTWALLFPGQEAGAPLVSGDVATRSLALTGSFETGHLAPECFAAVTGNFDGQGMSFGALQWNFGQGSLQPLLKRLLDEHPDVAEKVFGNRLDELRQAVLGGRDASMRFAASIQAPGGKNVAEPWRTLFHSLGLTPEFQVIERDGAAAYFDRAVRLCSAYGLWSERGRALMFDICVQNGSIADATAKLIQSGFAALSANLPPEEAEVERMRIVANRRAEAANPRFVEDVRTRKLCIAEGRGTVHGIAYDLEGQFGLGLRRVA